MRPPHSRVAEKVVSVFDFIVLVCGKAEEN
jgi:hypothetical protein